MTDLLTVAQAAFRLGVSTARVRFLIGRGRLPATRMDARLWLITAADLETFAAERQARADSGQ